MLFDTALLQEVCKSVDAKGLVAGSKKLFHILCIPPVSAKGSCPQKGPTLIIANHNGVFDTHLLLQTIKRTDYKFVALAIYKIFGKSVTTRLFPIYRHIPWLHRLYEFPLQYEIIGTFPTIYSHEEARVKNRKTIKQAVQWVSDGGALSLFPTGSVGTVTDGHKWKPGVGHLVKQITNSKTKVVFAHITGTRKSDVGAYFNSIFRPILFKPKQLLVQYSKSRLLSDLVNTKERGREIAQRLEREYNSLFPSGQ